MYCDKESKNCHFKKKIPTNSASWVSTLLIIILPKCPFCVMAYSGAMTLCSGKMLYPNSGSDSVYMILALSLLVIVGIGMNYRGIRTMISLAIAAVGILSLLMSQLHWYSEAGYYVSVLIIITAVWNNGSLHYFISKIYKNYIINYSKI